MEKVEFYKKWIWRGNINIVSTDEVQSFRAKCWYPAMHPSPLPPLAAGYMVTWCGGNVVLGPGTPLHVAASWRGVRYSTVQYSTVQYSTVHLGPRTPLHVAASWRGVRRAGGATWHRAAVGGGPGAWHDSRR